jgi:hypothetical protein
VQSLGFNIANDDSCGLAAEGDWQNIDPMLGPLADNGGPTETHMLLPGSVAIDQGWCRPGVDQRGFFRPVDLLGISHAGNACDIGAVEVQRWEFDTTPPVTTAHLSGLAGNAGWYRGPVQVTLIAVDPDDAVAATVYTLDGGPPVTYLAPFTISGDGLHQLSFFSTDHAGNQEVGHVLVVKIDSTPR